MRNQIKLTDRLSASNQYYSKKKPRKLGPIGKVLLGVAAVLIVFILVYEVGSSNNTSTNEPLGSANIPIPASSQEEKLDRQYQELLKRGKKYTNTARADSIRKAAAKIAEAEGATKTTTAIPTPSSQTRIDPPVSSTTTKRTARLEPSNNSNIKGNTGTSSTNTSSSNTIKNINTSPEPSVSSPIASSTGPASEGPVEEVYYPAQSINGTVTSAADGTGISGVNVMIKGGRQGTVTDWKGNYSIDLTAGPGPRYLQFNYKGNRVEREVRPGKNTVSVKF